MKKKDYLFLFLLSAIWGSSFILIKKGLTSFSPGQLGSMRIIIAALFLQPILWRNRSKFKSFPLVPLIAFALLEIGLPPYLYSYAQMHVSSASAGILNSLVPLFTVLLGILFFRQSFHLRSFLGVLIGMIGALTLVIGGAEPTGGTLLNPWGLLIVAATLFYAIAANTAERYLQAVPATFLTAAAFSAMAIPAAFYLFCFDFPDWTQLNSEWPVSFFMICILAIIGSAVAIQLFSHLIQTTHALFASFVTYLIPVVAIFWALIDGESLRLSHGASLLLITMGIVLSTHSAPKKASPARD